MTTRKSQIYREALTLSRYRMMDPSRKRPYRPNGIRPEVWERAVRSVFEWDGLCAPHSRYPRRLRLYAYSRLAAHCDAQGFPITAEIAFPLETINACVAAQPLVSTSKANLRSWLMEGRQFVLRIPGEPSRTRTAAPLVSSGSRPKRTRRSLISGIGSRTTAIVEMPKA